MTVFATALVTGLTALVLSPWMRGVARTQSAWLDNGAHTLLAAFGGAGAALLATGWAELIAFAALATACALLVVIDLAAHRLPDIIIAPTYLVVYAALTAAAAITGDWGDLGRAAAATVILTLFYFVLAYISPAGLGLGDVKFSGLLGAFLGWLGWSNVLIGTLAAFILNAAVALALLLTTSATRRSDIPFGPAMVAGAVIGAWAPSALTTIG